MREGPWILLVATATVAAVVAACLAAEGPGEEGLRLAIRATARTSLALFLPAFAASALARLWPAPATRWLVANRRWLGLSFASSHFLHLAVVIALARRFPETFWAHTDLTTIIAGGLGYVLVAAMAATSNDRAVRLLGPRRWHHLHTVGLWYLFGVFLFSYLARAVMAPAHLPIALLLLAAWGLRIAARRATVARRAAAAS